MATILLASTDTDSEVLGDKVAGHFQLICLTYSSAPVVLQVRDPESNSAWVTARYNNTDIQFSAAGDVLDVTFTRHFDYRLHTATAGAVIAIDSHLGG